MPAYGYPNTNKKILTEEDVKVCETYLTNARDRKKTAEMLNMDIKQVNTILFAARCKRYMTSRIKKQTSELRVTFDDKVKKLKEIIDNAIVDDVPPQVAIQAIAELNKMQGHYSAEKHVNVNANVTLDPHLKKVTDLLEDLRKKYEKDY